MEWLAALIAKVFKEILPLILGQMKDTAEEGAVDRKRQKRAEAQIKRAGWTPEAIRKTNPKPLVKLVLLMALVGLLCSTAGCYARTIYVSEMTPVRLREPLEGVKVWVLDKDGVPVASKMDIPEGLFIVSMPPQQEEKDPEGP